MRPPIAPAARCARLLGGALALIALLLVGSAAAGAADAAGSRVDGSAPVSSAHGRLHQQLAVLAVPVDRWAPRADSWHPIDGGLSATAGAEALLPAAPPATRGAQSTASGVSGPAQQRAPPAGDGSVTAAGSPGGQHAAR
jgi:hypothetical protein